MWSLLLQITWDDLKAAEDAVGDFGSDNRAGVQGTLHRISAMRSRKGTIVGLTCRVGRAVTGHVDMIRDILNGILSPLAAVKRNGEAQCLPADQKSQLAGDVHSAKLCSIPWTAWSGEDYSHPRDGSHPVRRLEEARGMGTNTLKTFLLISHTCSQFHGGGWACF